MPPFGEEDLAAVLADAAGEVLWFGSVQVAAVIDEGAADVTDEMGTLVQVRGVSARVQTSALPASVAAETVAVRGSTGISYHVRGVPRKLGPDGAMTLLTLAKV